MLCALFVDCAKCVQCIYIVHVEHSVHSEQMALRVQGLQECRLSKWESYVYYE